MKHKDFTMINDNIVLDRELSASAFRVYAVLRYHAKFKTESSVSIPKIMKESGLSRRTVSRAINELERSGYINSRQRFNTSNVYTLTDRRCQNDTDKSDLGDVKSKRSRCQNETMLVSKVNDAGVKSDTLTRGLEKEEGGETAEREKERGQATPPTPGASLGLKEKETLPQGNEQGSLATGPTEGEALGNSKPGTASFQEDEAELEQDTNSYTAGVSARQRTGTKPVEVTQPEPERLRSRNIDKIRDLFSEYCKCFLKLDYTPEPNDKQCVNSIFTLALQKANTEKEAGQLIASVMSYVIMSDRSKNWYVQKFHEKPCLDRLSHHIAGLMNFHNTSKSNEWSPEMEARYYEYQSLEQAKQ